MSDEKKCDEQTVDENTAKEILRLAEARLAATLTIGIAQDQRATALVGIFSSVSTAIIGASYLSWRSEFFGLAIAGWVAGFMFFVGASFACLAARSSSCHVIGADYAETSKLLNYKVSILYIQQAKIQDSLIEQNRSASDSSGKRINWAIASGLMAPMLGLIAGLLYRFFGVSLVIGFGGFMGGGGGGA